MSSVEKVYHKQAARLLLICFHARKALTVMTASKFDEEDISFGLATKSQPLDCYGNTQRVEVTSRRIKARCIDLLEVWENRVNFLHRTVYEFLDLPDTRRVLDGRAGNDFDTNNYFCNAMLYQIKTLPTAGGKRQYSNPPYPHQPIDDLVIEFMCYAEELDSRRKLDHRLLDDLISPVEFYRRLEPALYQRSWLWPSLFLDGGCQEGWIIALALYYGIDGYIRAKSGYVQSLIKKKVYIDEHSLLAVALRLIKKTEYVWPENRTPIKPCVVATLLELGAHPNEFAMAYPNGSAIRLPIWCAFLLKVPESLTPEKRQAYITIAELLLRNGEILIPGMYSRLKTSLFRSCSSEEATYLHGVIENVIERRIPGKAPFSIKKYLVGKKKKR